MSLFSFPPIARATARFLQAGAPAQLKKQAGGVEPTDRLPEFVADRTELAIPVAPPAPAVVYTATGAPGPRPVHVNFHGGGYVMGQTHGDDALCRAIAQHGGAVVIDVDYVVAPQHPFPAPVDQAVAVVRWVIQHAAEHGWDPARVTVGGQSSGGALAAAVARVLWREGERALRLQVLHYPPLDLTVPAAQKHSPLAKPLLRPWLGEVFDTSYVPAVAERANPLVSPAAVSDTDDLTGIAPALVIAAEFDILHDEDVRYARRLDDAGALIELITIAGADHAYDAMDDDLARTSYLRIAEAVRAAG